MPDPEIETSKPVAPQPKPKSAQEIRNEVRLRVQKMQATSYARAVSVLNDVRKKLDSANQLLNNASEAHDDAFEVTADQLLEQAAKQLDAVENGINSFRADLKNLRANI